MKCILLGLLTSLYLTLIATPIPWREPTYTLIARELPLREAIESFATAQGLNCILSEQIQGVINGDFKDVPTQTFLEQLCATHHLMWYLDGTTLYLYTADEVCSTLLSLHHLTEKDVQTMLYELNLKDERFPLKSTDKGNLLLLTGPPRYIQLICELIAKAETLRKERTYCEVETRIFPITHTWADDVSLNTATPEGSSTEIKGVATLLSELIDVTDSAARDTCVTNSPPIELDQVERSFSPVIKADNRLNAVVIRDTVSRMPMYERLIKRLDVAQPLIEIGVTVLELSHEDALDWELSMRAKGASGSVNGGVGSAVNSLLSADTLSGRGLSGAFAYIGDTFNVEASISALQNKGKAQHISRSSLLTLNNMSAEITDTQTYHVKVVGDNLATLESVTAGTQLRIKPRIVPPSTDCDSNAQTQIWLTMELEDGGFEAITVESMPMTRESTLATQAAVKEGESLLLAGYLRDINAEQTWGVPYLREIPLIGWLFGGKSQTDTTMQRMFILTPRIITLNTTDTVHRQAANQRDLTIEHQLSEDAVNDVKNAEEE